MSTVLGELADVVRRESGIALRESQYRALAAAARRAAPDLDAAALLRALGDARSRPGLLRRLIDEVTINETFFLRQSAELEALDWATHVGRRAGRGRFRRARLGCGLLHRGGGLHARPAGQRGVRARTRAGRDPRDRHLHRRARACGEGRLWRALGARCERRRRARYFEPPATAGSPSELACVAWSGSPATTSCAIQCPPPASRASICSLPQHPHLLRSADGRARGRFARRRGAPGRQADPRRRRPDQRSARPLRPWLAVRRDARSAPAPPGTAQADRVPSEAGFDAALAAADAGRLDTAIELIGHVLSRDPLNADAHFVRGLAELGAGDADALRSIPAARALCRPGLRPRRVQAGPGA